MVLTTLTKQHEKEFLQTIQQRLLEILGGDSPGGEILEELKLLADFIWQMVMEPAYTLEEFRKELTEFLGDSTEFLHWLQENVLEEMRYLREEAARSGHSIVIKDDAEQVRDDTQKEDPVQTDHGEGDIGDKNDGDSHIAEMLNMGKTQALLKVKRRCRAFPNCEFGEFCRYIHPNEMCTMWPSCAFGAQCFFLHPQIPCKYRSQCLRWMCNYMHEEPLQSGSGLNKNLTWFQEGTDQNDTAGEVGGDHSAM